MNVVETVTDHMRGLTTAEAEQRLSADGYNELPSAVRRSAAAIMLEVLREPMFLLLIVTGALYFALGSLEDALLLMVFVLVIIGITFFQERRTERALEALRGLASPRALVIRDGEKKRIAGREVVRDDIVLIAEGDRVPADGRLVSVNNLSIDESLLTGESAPVRKTAAAGREAAVRPGGDNLPFVYSGTLVVQGQGIARVTATGAATEMGKIGKILQSLKPEPARLQKETRKIVRNLALIGGSLCVLVVVVYGCTRQDWLNGVLAGITLAMAVIPEEFPVVLTIFLALGAWRIAQKRVLTRRVPAVETLGSATVLCVDKTGTITQNRMSVQLLCHRGRCIAVDGGERHLPEDFHPLVEFSVLASRRNPFDPMEKAFAALCGKTLAHTEHVHYNWELVQEYPLEPQLLAMSRVWRSPAGSDYVIAAKGSPESVIDLCHLPESEVRQLMVEVRRMAEKGLRVLGVARSSYFPGSPLPGRQHAFDFEFLGFIGLADPVRPEVPAAVRECHDAGIRVVMITGDYPETAKNIAARTGLRDPDRCVTGTELDAQGKAFPADRLRSVNVFARVAPAQKLFIVRALKKNGEVTAMTGDGVNDAPALKAADIGIAMGGRGTDVAREAAALVLLDDDFSSIVAAVRMGRRIYDNIRKAMSYILAVHVTVAGMAVLPVIFKLPLVLLPVHIVFLQLVIDPASSIAFEAEPAEPDIMNRPPRAVDEPVFGKRSVILSLLQGLSVLVILIAVYVLALSLGGGEDNARALAFTTLIVANLGLILTNRSWSKTMLASFRARNTALVAVLASTVVVLAAVLYIPFLQRLFHFGTLHPVDLLISFAAGIIGILWFEALKALHAVKK